MKTTCNPWMGIWVRPRETIRTLIDNCPRKLILWLALFSGAIGGLSSALFLYDNSPDMTPGIYALYVVTLLIVGAALGLAHLYLFGWLYGVVGRWLGGVAHVKQTTCAVGWSNYPYLIVGILGVLAALTIPNVWLYAFFATLQFVAMWWGFIVFLKLIGEAHRFSAWKALGAFVIVLCMVFIVVVILGLIWSGIAQL